MTKDWFRNTTWDDQVEQLFEEKLRRARRKEQYLRIQASMLASSHPDVALRLLDRYFELPDDFDHAQAHVDRARAHLAQKNLSAAIASYEAALSREKEFPNVRTQAYLDLPYLIATNGVRERYDRARELLEAHKQDLLFPVDQFRWHAAKALISAAKDRNEMAEAHALKALEVASREHSGFRYHPSIGLVEDRYDDVVRELKALATGR